VTGAGSDHGARARKRNALFGVAMVRRLWNLLPVWSLAGVILFTYAAYSLFHKALDYFDGGDAPSALARGVAGAFCLGIALLILWSISAEYRRNAGPHYFKWFADGQPVPESYVAGCARTCSPTCTAACLARAKESVPAGHWLPRIEGGARVAHTGWLHSVGLPYCHGSVGAALVRYGPH